MTLLNCLPLLRLECLTIYAVINNENDRNADRNAFQKELDKLQLWCSTWGLIINYNKCKIIHIF